MTTGKPLVELIRDRLAGDLRGLPVFHSVAVKLQQMLVSRDFRIEEVIRLINEDQSLASQVLRMGNSSFYTGLSKVATIKDAVVRLGAQEIANLVMMASQAEQYKSGDPVLDNFLQKLWDHALSCATGATWLASKAGYASLATEAFMGGLLHDIGKLAIIKALDEILQAGGTKATISEILINEILDTMHEDVGNRLMLSWSLPEIYCSIAVNHHNTEYDGNDILLVIVRLANLACRKVGKALTPDPAVALFGAPEAQFLGIKEIALAELEIIVEDAGTQAA
ncbi:HDOD domain-containing protein [Oryzomonas japonica]|uniref:HDOD domain-containing protein n=1 Tax=Oryzomonas japonica TaxID=2603858 RepID=A0A7J4ZSN9_9BACT|nr:HDOD domain-containing protein [Oryzomonas japonica]KAB0666230.1 HDOD domain-containing protein [Oryzomonas japonica]